MKITIEGNNEEIKEYLTYMVVEYDEDYKDYKESKRIIGFNVKDD